MGRPPARPAHRSAPGSSPPLALRQRLHQRRHRRRIDRSSDPHPAAARKLDLDHAGSLGYRRRRRRFGCRRDCDRIKRRRNLHALTQLLAPAKQLAGMDPSCAGDLRSDRARLQRRRNDPLLLRSLPASASLHRRDHFNLRLGHRSSPRITPRTCRNGSTPQGGPHRANSLPSSRVAECGITSELAGCRFVCVNQFVKDGANLTRGIRPIRNASCSENALFHAGPFTIIIG